MAQLYVPGKDRHIADCTYYLRKKFHSISVTLTASIHTANCIYQ